MALSSGLLLLGHEGFSLSFLRPQPLWPAGGQRTPAGSGTANGEGHHPAAQAQCGRRRTPWRDAPGFTPRHR